MSHYKSNLRDLEFNLFEVFGGDGDDHPVLGQGPYAEVDADTARSVLAEVDRLAREDLAASYASGDRNPPVFDPATHTAPLPEDFRRSYQAFMDAEFWRLDLPPELGGTQRPADAVVVAGRAGARLQRTDLDVRLRPVVRAHPVRRGHPGAEGVGQALRREAVGLHDGADRAGRRLRRRRRPRPGHPAAGRLLAHRGRQALHHQRRARPDRQHHPLRAGPAGRRRRRRRPGHEGPVAVRGAEVPLLSMLGDRDRRARRAQRRLRHQRRAQDGPQGLQHLRADLRRARHAGQGLAARRRARRHPADVPHHRVRPDDGRHEGDRHPVDRLPQRPRVRQEPGAGRRPAPPGRQDRAAGHHHPPPGRPPLARAAEGVRRGAARAGLLHGALAGPGAAGRGRRRRGRRPQAAERVNDLLLPLVKGCGSERAYELLGHESLQTFGGSGYLQDYPLEQYVRDAKIDTLYEGTTAIQSLDLVFRKIVKDGGRALDGRSPARSSPSSTREAGNGQLKEERLALGAALADVQGMLGHRHRLAGRRRRRRADRARTRSACPRGGSCSPSATWSSAGCCSGRPRSPWPRWAATAISAADRAFYEGKVASARFFAREVLPRLSSDRRIVEGTTLDIMELPEEAF